MASSSAARAFVDDPEAPAPPPPPARPRSRPLGIWKRGEPLIWLTGGGLAVCLVAIVWILLLVASRGLFSFWPQPLVKITATDGKSYLAEVLQRQPTPKVAGKPVAYRIQAKIANRDLNGLDFKWFDESEIVRLERPADALLLERQEYGNFHGFLKGVRRGEERLADGGADGLATLRRLQAAIRPEFQRVRRSERFDVAKLNAALEHERMTLKRAELSNQPDLARIRARVEARIGELERQYEDLRSRLEEDARRNASTVATVVDASGREKDVPVQNIVRIVTPNTLGFAGKLGVAASRISEYLFDDPRESNTEGGVFPAIFGTVLMVLMMSVAVVPFGVIAAVYLREYAHEGPLVRIVRIAVNNLAGVPSIVFGIFGLGFFVYGAGALVDRTFFAVALPTPTFGTGGILWCSLTLALLTVPVVIVASEEALAAVPRGMREASLALGATKWQTTWNVVLPAAAPGILTGLILAMARGTGEVAPLMIVGVVKLAPSLPLDGTFPFLHLDRKIMHLGFHIYDVGFQSPNVEAALPMVYSTALLLVAVVVLLNLFAILIRNRLRKKLQSAAF